MALRSTGKFELRQAGEWASLLLTLCLAVSCDRGRLPLANAAAASSSAARTEAPAVRGPQVAPGLELVAPLPPRNPAPPATPPARPTAAAEDAGELRVVVLTPRSAKVVWTTPERADSEVHWGLTQGLEQRPILQPDPVFQHVVLLRDLEPGTFYYVQALSRSGGAEPATSPVVSFQTLEEEKYQVRKTHPRIFLTSDDLPALRRKIATTHAQEWAELRRACEAALGKPADDIALGGSSCAYARAFAFAGLVGSEARFKKKAEEIALACVRAGDAGGKMNVRLRVMGVACVYDWLHDDLSAAVRSRLQAGLMSWYGLLEGDSNDREFVWGHSHGNHRPMALAALALHGEDRTATEALDGILRNYRDGFFATWRNYGDEGGSLKGWWYTAWTLDMEVEVLAAVASATNVNWFQTEAWFSKLVDWFAIGFRSDGTFPRSGDHRPNYTVSQIEWSFALCAAHYTRNPRARWLARSIAAREKIWSLYYPFAILWDDPDVPAEAPSGAEVRLFRTPGQLVLRSSWDDNAVIGTFRSSTDYTLGHTHLDDNSFTLFYRGGLALNSGMYDTFGSDHHINYYRRSIAHNTILVYDPSETFLHLGKPVVNDGGQRMRSPKLDGIARSFPARVEETLDPAKGYRAGGILLYEDTAELTYALGDAAPSYSKEKVSQFDRHFLWLKSIDRRQKPGIVIFDQVVSRSPSFKKTYLLHTQNRPRVQGNLISAENDGGLLYQETLLPAAPRLEIVGGPGKEYLVGGKNFPTTREPTAKDETGVWRVEVSPSKASARDFFLHVLSAEDAGAGLPLSSELVEAAGAVGCRVEDWVVLFGTARKGADVVSYEAPRGAARHLVTGLVPGARYEISVGGKVTATGTTTLRGLLRFDSSAPGAHEVRRVSVAAPAMITAGADAGASQEASLPGDSAGAGGGSALVGSVDPPMVADPLEEPEALPHDDSTPAARS